MFLRPMNKKRHHLAALRYLTKLPGRELAPLLGISYPRLVAIESGRLRLPPETACRAAAVFGVDADSLSTAGELKAWDGTLLTASKLQEYRGRAHDPARFRLAWEHSMSLQLRALIEATSSDATKSRILLAEFTSWMEEMRRSLDVEDATKNSLAAVVAPTLKRHIETTVGSLRAWCAGRKSREPVLGEQWSQIDRSDWKGDLKVTLVEEIRRLWSPLYSTKRQGTTKAPIDHPWVDYLWKVDVFVRGMLAGSLSIVRALASDDPYAAGLGWSEPPPADLGRVRRIKEVEKSDLFEGEEVEILTDKQRVNRKT